MLLFSLFSYGQGEVAQDQTNELIFKNQSIGYWNEDSVPVITKNLIAEDAALFRKYYPKFIYLPSPTIDSLVIDSLVIKAYSGKTYNSNKTPGLLLKEAGVLKNTAIGINLLGGVLVGGIALNPQNSYSNLNTAGIILGSTGIVSIVLNAAANQKLISAGDLMEKEEKRKLTKEKANKED